MSTRNIDSSMELHDEQFKQVVKRGNENRTCPNRKCRYKPMNLTYHGVYVEGEVLNAEETGSGKGGAWVFGGYYPVYFCKNCGYVNMSDVPTEKENEKEINSKNENLKLNKKG